MPTLTIPDIPLQRKRVRGSDLVSYSYAAITRYVTPASDDLVQQKVYFQDINPADVLPSGLPLPPVGMQFIHPDENGMTGRTIPQFAPDILQYAHNTPGVNWYFKFAFWVLQGGRNQVPPDPAYKGMPSPTAEMTEDNVVTMAVYDFSGGPDIDTAAWNVRAWVENDIGTFPKHPLSGDYFRVLTDGSAARDVRANTQHLVDTEGFAGPQQVRAITTPATNPYALDPLVFSHWTINSDTANPIYTDTITLPLHTSGTAIAWYRRVRADVDPPPETYDPWWWIKTHGGLVPPPGTGPWTREALELFAALNIARQANGLAPELRARALELASAQAERTAAALKKGGEEIKKSGNGIKAKNGKDDR